MAAFPQARNRRRGVDGSREAPQLKSQASNQEEKGTILDQSTRTELEAAAFRRLRQHLSERTDVQNIDLMNMAGFCRNCLARWYQEEAEKRDIAMTKDAAREAFYGMPYDVWRDMYQTEATDAQKADFEKAGAGH